MIKNKFCANCKKSSVCEWYKKLIKLDGNEKNPSPLAMIVDNCDEFLNEIENN